MQHRTATLTERHTLMVTAIGVLVLVLLGALLGQVIGTASVHAIEFALRLSEPEG
ncbi:MAG: hypothetical protein JWN84_4533 [Nocardioides sp.]|jgi:hypothetical protein|nr:hypothetical protein [Nocardioides sp.]